MRLCNGNALKASVLPYINRKKREADRLAQAPWEVQTIKYCDLCSNTNSIVQHDPNFAKTYLAEKQYLLSVMNGGIDALYMRALQNVANI